jgi:hypothetical protein
MKMKVLLWLAVAAVTSGMAAPAACQECRASLQSQPLAWSALQTEKQPDTAQMKLFVEIACRECDPATVVEVFAGMASANFRSMPLAQKTGTEFAEAVVSDDQERSNFLETTLAAESSPGCVMDGQINGVFKIGAMGVIVANTRAHCDRAPENLRAVFLSGYDGQCLYRVRIVWPGWAGLSDGVQDQVQAVLDQIRLGP